MNYFSWSGSTPTHQHHTSLPHHTTAHHFSYFHHGISLSFYLFPLEMCSCVANIVLLLVLLSVEGVFGFSSDQLRNFVNDYLNLVNLQNWSELSSSYWKSTTSLVFNGPSVSCFKGFSSVMTRMRSRMLQSGLEKRTYKNFMKFSVA